MSAVKIGQRYALATPRAEHIAGWWSIKVGMTTSESGDYVLASDYAALQAQNAELRASIEKLEPCACEWNDAGEPTSLCDAHKAQLSALQAERERLMQALDACVQHLEWSNERAHEAYVNASNIVWENKS